MQQRFSPSHLFKPSQGSREAGGRQLVTVPSDKAPTKFSGHKTVMGESTGADHVDDFIWKARHSSLIKETKKHPMRKEEGEFGIRPQETGQVTAVGARCCCPLLTTRASIRSLSSIASPSNIPRTGKPRQPKSSCPHLKVPFKAHLLEIPCRAIL